MPAKVADSTAQGYGTEAIITSNRALWQFSYHVTLTLDILTSG